MECILVAIGIFILLFTIGKTSELFKKTKDAFSSENPGYQNGSNKKSTPKNGKFKNFEIEIDRDSKEFITFYHRVVGIGYTQSTKNACAFATKVYLKAEDNPHDKYAIAVYNQDNDRIGYIPKGDKKFLTAYHSYDGCVAEITHKYANEEQKPIKFCQLDIMVTFCGDFQYLIKAKSEVSESDELRWELADLRKELKDKDISDADKYAKISDLNRRIFLFNQKAERINWVTIPMRETIILMNKLKLTNQVEFIGEYFDFTEHTKTQKEYIEKYLEKNN